MYERSANLIQNKFKNYLIPTILMTMALSLGVVVDSMIVSFFIGNDAFSAVQICSPVMLCYNAFFTLIGVGGSTFIAILKGKKDEERTNEVFSISIYLLALISIVFIVLGMLFMDNLVGILTNNNSTVDMTLVKKYLSVTVYGAPFFIIVSGFIPFIRIDGKPKLGSKIIIISNIVNLSFDFIFVGVMKIGITGAAISSILGYILGGTVIIFYLKSNERTLKFVKPKRIRDNTLNLFAIGITSALATGFMFMKNILINRIILSYLGNSGIISYTACCNCLTLATMFIGGTVQTLLPIIGVLYGEEDKKGISIALKTAIKFAISACFIIFVLLQIFPNIICILFSVKEPDVIQSTIRAIRIYTFTLPLYTFTFIMLSFYQTTEKKKLSVVITAFQSLLFVVPMVYLFANFDSGQYLWYGFIVSDILASLLVIVLAFSYAFLSKGKFKGLLLQTTCDCGNKFKEMTIKNDEKEAVGLSYKILEFCKENKVSNTVAQCAALSVEEMAINIIKYGYNRAKLSYIDVNIKIVDGAVIIRLRDDGVFFNPVVFKFDETKEFSGIETVKKVAKDMSYSRVLGFNNTIIKF